MNRGALILAAVYALGPAAGFAQDESKTPKTFQVTPTGYIQLDFRAFPQWSVQPGTGSLNRDYVEVRRLRGGVDGHWRRLAFEVKVDPQDEDGARPAPANGAPFPPAHHHIPSSALRRPAAGAHTSPL